MESKSGRDNKFYALIAVLIIILIFITVIISSNELFQSYVDDDVLTNGWYENNKSHQETGFLGLEKQVSFNYNNDNESYAAYLTVSSFKTIFMISEEDLIDLTIETINEAMEDRNISIDTNSIKEGQRVLKNNHKTNYVTYNASKMINNFVEEFKIIGESWNCDKSGSSIVVIGYAQITNKSLDQENKEFSYFAKMIKDPANTFDFIYKDNTYPFLGDDGLIFNIICH